MRIFWAVLIVAIAGAGFLIFSGGDDSSHTPAIQTATPAPQVSQSPARDDAVRDTPVDTPVDTPPPQTAEETITEATAEDLALLDLANDVELTVPAPVVEETKAEITETTDEVAIDDEEESDELEIVKLTADDIAEALSETATPVPAETENSNDAPAPPGWEALAANAKENNESAAEAPAAESLEIKHLEDGNLQIGKFTITGKGTKEAPYALPWDFLVSIRESYSPREDKKTIPDHLSYFEGKYISIAGYLQFPLAAPEPTECLVMLNQWDGCCIGVPPTPYDAIEVALSTPATQAQKFAVEGRIVGKLDIDPYLVGNWLIGLYLLGDATVDISGARTAEELYGNTPSQLQPGQ